jgi:hypothetical protein
MRVDQSRYYRPSVEFYDPRAPTNQHPHVTVAADRDKTPVPDSDRLPDRKIAIDGNNLAVAQHQIGGSRHGQGTLKVYLMSAAAGG